MKRNIFTVVLPALLVASSVNATELLHTNKNKLHMYGKIVGLHYFSENQNFNGTKSHFDLGMKGETKISDFLTGYGQWEYNIQLNNSEGYIDSQFKNGAKLGFTGIKLGDYGSIDYGRNYGILYDAESFTDVLPEFSGEYVYTDNFLTGRAMSLATYRNYNFFNLIDGLNFAIQFQGKNERSSFQRISNGYGWGFSTSYTSPNGFGIVGAFSKNQRSPYQTDKKIFKYGNIDKTAVSWDAAIKYDANNIYLAFLYGENQRTTFIIDPLNKPGFANKTKKFEVVAQYHFNFGLRTSIAYMENKAKDVETFGDVDLSKYFELGATYFFNKNMSTYIDYRINELDHDNQMGNNIFNIIALGLIYKF